MMSIELGMGFSIMFLFIMILTNLWPIRLLAFLSDAFPTEEFLLNHLCLKWDVDTELPKLEKLSRLKQALEEALQVKANFDKRARELAKEKQADPLVYRKLIEGPLWDQMDKVIDEMISQECCASYWNLQDHIGKLKDVEKP